MQNQVCFVCLSAIFSVQSFDVRAARGNLKVTAKNTIIEKEFKNLRQGNYVNISIIDRGEGIYEDRLEEIFEPYFTTKEFGVQNGISNPDLVTVSLRYPNAVICLISALSYHNITTQIPHAVSVAVPRDSRVPSLDYPPIQAHRFSNDAYTSGIENHSIDGVPVKVYTPEKTLADCFKFRNKVGLDTVVANELMKSIEAT